MGNAKVALARTVTVDSDKMMQLKLRKKKNLMVWIELRLIKSFS
jgi:hypothetical protein